MKFGFKSSVQNAAEILGIVVGDFNGTETRSKEGQETSWAYQYFQ